MSWADENNLRFDESHFIMSGEQVTVTASLIPANQSDWGIECRGNGKVLNYCSCVCSTAHMIYEPC